jgi:hypothetical protein
MHFNQGPPHEHPPHGPHGHPPPPPHGPPPPHPPKEPHHPAEKGNIDFSNDGERTLESHHKLPFYLGEAGDENDLPREHEEFDELNNEFDGEQKLDSHRKFHGFPEENEEFDGERKLDSHHRGFPKHHRPKTLDMPPSPHHRPPHGHHGHHPPPPPGIGLLFDEGNI